MTKLREELKLFIFDIELDYAGQKQIVEASLNDKAIDQLEALIKENYIDKEASKE